MGIFIILEKCKNLEGLWKDRGLKVGDWVYWTDKPIKPILIRYYDKQMNWFKGNTELCEFEYSKCFEKEELTLIPSTKDMLEKIRKNRAWDEIQKEFDIWEVLGKPRYDIDDNLADWLIYLIENKYIEVEEVSK